MYKRNSISHLPAFFSKYTTGLVCEWIIESLTNDSFKNRLIPQNPYSCFPLLNLWLLSMLSVTCIQILHMFRLAHRPPLPFLEVATATQFCSPSDWLSKSELSLPVFCLFHLIEVNSRHYKLFLCTNIAMLTLYL